MTDRLTRTERAACELALGVLRRDVAGWPDRVPSHGDLKRYVETLALGGVYLEAEPPHYDGTPRLLFRARLALYLRALLRADRGDCGPWRAGRYDTRQRAYDITRRMRPLWQVAGEARREVER